jgi:hypothetical protein
MAVALGIWTPWARLLKVLPLSSTQINTLLLISPFATWTVLWILGWSAYALAYGASDNLRIEFTIGMASISALVHAVMLRVQGGFGTIWVMVALGGLMAPMVKIGLRDEIAYQIAFGIIAASALGMAAFINHRTLTRSTSSSRPYRLPRAPFGAPSMPGAR